MKKIGICLAITLTCAASFAFGVDKAELDEVVTFEESLKSLALAVRGEAEPPPQDKVLIIDGVVSGVQVIDAEEESFRARIELVSGEWQGLENIMMYKTYVDIAGAEFFHRVPSRANRRPTGGAIETNNRIVVAGRFEGETAKEEGLEEEGEGAPIPVLEAFYVLTLQ